MSGLDPTEELLKKYEIPYPRCGAGVGDGWLPLLERLIVDLIALGWNKECAQIKEKFGGLRFYLDYTSPALDARIDQAETESLRTCEVCGAPGKRGGSGWISTRCDAHRT